MLGRQRLARGADGIDLVVFRSTRSPDTTDLNDILAGVDEATNEPRSETCGALERPDAPTRGVPSAPLEQALVSGCVRCLRSLCLYPAGSGVDDSKVDGVPVGIAADDVVVVICQHD